MKQTQLLLIFSLFLLLLFSCTPQEKENFDRSVSVFFLGLFQVFNIVLFGISSFILCLLGTTSQKKLLKIIGGCLLAVFVLFGALGLLAVLEERPRHNTVYILFVFEFMIVATNIVLLFVPLKKTISDARLTDNRQRFEADNQNDLIDF